MDNFYWDLITSLKFLTRNFSTKTIKTLVVFSKMKLQLKLLLSTISFGDILTSTHPLPLNKIRAHFNAWDNQYEAKQQILLELDNIVISVSVDILSFLASAPLTWILLHNYFFKSRSIIDPMLTWMDDF